MASGHDFMLRLIGLTLAVAIVVLAAPAAAQKRCKGTKKLYQGKCMYPEEIKRLKGGSQPKPTPRPWRGQADRKSDEEQAAEARRKADHAVCSLARRIDTLEGWQQYVQSRPEGSCLEEARLRIAKLEAEPPPPDPTGEPAAPPPPADDGAMSPWFWVGTGAAAASFVTWGIGGIVALSKASSLDEACPDNVCPPDKEGDLDGATSVAHLTTASFAVMMVGIGVGVFGLVDSMSSDGGDDPDRAADEARVRPMIGPGFVGVIGAF